MRDYDIKEKGLSGEEVYGRVTWRQAYKMKKKFADRKCEYLCQRKKVEQLKKTFKMHFPIG